MENEEEDFALALKLFGELNQDNEDGNQTSATESRMKNNKQLSIVDPSWELIDPVPNIRDLFIQFNMAYFEGKLASVEVKWSNRMTM